MEASIVSFAHILEEAHAAESLRHEAWALQCRYGKNIYSDFLTKFGRRPDVKQAAVIGRHLDARVEAIDGSLQPKLSDPERAELRDERAARRAELKLQIEASRLSSALDVLSKCQPDVALLVSHLVNEGEGEQLLRLCESAIEWLTRFAKEWCHHGEEVSAD